MSVLQKEKKGKDGMWDNIDPIIKEQNTWHKLATR